MNPKVDKMVENMLRESRDLHLNVQNATDGLSGDDYQNLIDLSHNGIIHNPGLVGDRDTIDEIPMPWDAGIEIKGDKLIISGSAGPSGWGKVTVEVPKKDITRYNYDFIIEPRGDEAEKKIIEILAKYNITVEE